MAEETRIYTVPLRVVKNVPRNHRAKRAVTAVRDFAARHMKTEKEKVWIDNPVNEKLWARSIQKPPSKIRIKVIKFDDGVVEVSLPETTDEGAPVAEAKADAPGPKKTKKARAPDEVDAAKERPAPRAKKAAPKKPKKESAE